MGKLRESRPLFGMEGQYLEQPRSPNTVHDPTEYNMNLASSAPPSSVTFPTLDPAQRPVQPTPHARPPYLPFRRISLPTAPSLIHRESMISVASFESLPENDESQARILPAVLRNVHPPRKSRKMASESPRRRRRDAPTKHIDDAKRRNIIEEFYETERSYVDGLELIYSHFLTPIIASLDTPTPLLDRTSLTSVFSNFIDIWNLHHSFLSSLSTQIFKAGIQHQSSVSNHEESPPPLSSILLSHFPYLSLYNPFITSFPSAISTLSDLSTPPTSIQPNPKYNLPFTKFLAAQEADPRCGKLKLRDWLLTIVQRCPRYLLLLKDLISYTDHEDPEHAQLTAVHTLVSKITLSLDTSLRTHAQTLALLSLQRCTPNLPFQLIAPGRTLLKRGPLLQIEGSGQPRGREFLLLSDCLIWLAGEDEERMWKGEWGISRSGKGAGYLGSEPLSSPSSPTSSPQKRPPMLRTRSRSAAELSAHKVNDDDGDVDREAQTPSSSTPTTPSKAAKIAARRSYHPPPSSWLKRHGSSGAGEERWVYKGRAELVDLEVVLTPPREEGEERRFEVLSPEGSFALYSATEEERDEWCTAIRQAKAQLLVSLNATNPNSTLTSSSSTNHLRRSLQALPFPPSDERIATIRDNHVSEASERRRKVEHWVPAIWIPDEKTGECMRCGRSFGWRRRRHHCRLCGRCVCASCSDRTFYISETNAKSESSKPARACDACYETVFPLVQPHMEWSDAGDTTIGTIRRKDLDSLASLHKLPSWLSMPSLPSSSSTSPQALMAIERESSSTSTSLHDLSSLVYAEKHGRVKVKSPQNARPRSYHQLVQDFEQNEYVRFDVLDTPLEEEIDGEADADDSDVFGGEVTSPSSRVEDTVRKNKRFSLPAVTVQPMSVTARTTVSGNASGSSSKDGGGTNPARTNNNRFSLVLGGNRNQTNKAHQGDTKPPTNDYPTTTRVDLSKGVAAGKLNQLLGRRKE